MQRQPHAPQFRGFLAILAGAAAFSAFCSRAPAPEPPLPAPRLETFHAQARAQLKGAYEAAAADSASVQAISELALLYHAYERYEAAAACYARLRRLAPNEPGWAYLYGVVLDVRGQTDDAFAQLRQAHSLPAAQLRLVEMLLKADNIAGARVEAAKLAADHPNLARAQHLLGRTLERDGNFAAAADAYQKAATLAPRSGEPLYALAMLHRRAGNAAAARAAMDQFEKSAKEGMPVDDPWMDRVRAARRDPGYYVEEGRRAMNSGDLDQAIKAFQQALDMDSKFGPAHANLVAAHGAAGRLADAERHYRAAAAAGVTADELHTNWGLALLNVRRVLEAEKAFRLALEANPRSADALANLGVCLLHRGEREQAAASFRRAIDADSNHRPARLNLGRQLLASGQTGEAIDHLTRAAQPQDEQTARYLYALADACNKAGRRQEAIIHASAAAALARQYGQTELERQIQEGLKILRSGK